MQLFLGLVRPFEILLLDEVTVSLDVVVRQDLLRWLRRETEVGWMEGWVDEWDCWTVGWMDGGRGYFGNVTRSIDSLLG